jgi:hypothetical protein
MAEATPTTTPAKTPARRTASAKTAAPSATSNSAAKTKTGVVAKAKDATKKLAKEATAAARNAANEGKDKASEALTNVSKAVEGAATLVEEKVGPAYGTYARKAADKVSDVATSLQNKDVDELIEDTREFVRKQPMVALGAAVAIGFVLTRVFKIGAAAADDESRA